MNTRLNYLIARERSPNGSCRRPSARLPLTGLSPLQFQLTANHQQQRDDHPLRPQTLDPGAPGDGRLPRRCSRQVHSLDTRHFATYPHQLTAHVVAACCDNTHP